MRCWKSTVQPKCVCVCVLNVSRIQIGFGSFWQFRTIYLSLVHILWNTHTTWKKSARSVRGVRVLLELSSPPIPIQCRRRKKVILSNCWIVILSGLFFPLLLVLSLWLLPFYGPTHTNIYVLDIIFVSFSYFSLKNLYANHFKRVKMYDLTCDVRCICIQRAHVQYHTP